MYEYNVVAAKGRHHNAAGRIRTFGPSYPGHVISGDAQSTKLCHRRTTKMLLFCYYLFSIYIITKIFIKVKYLLFVSLFIFYIYYIKNFYKSQKMDNLFEFCL